jgi:hypothetical protein
MIFRLITGIALFGIGYALGKEMGRTQEIRSEQKRLDPDQSHKVKVVDYSKDEYENPDSHLSSNDRPRRDPHGGTG